MNKCCVLDCPKAATATVYCQMHYRRYRLYGDPLCVQRKQRRKFESSSIRIAGDIAYIELTQGYYAIIDAIDVPLVKNKCWNWSSTTGYAYWGNQSLHQFLMGKAPNGLRIDHDDRNKLNCCRRNLLFKTPSENAKNSDRSDANKGYNLHKASGKYQVYLFFGKEQVYLGLALLEEEAKSRRAKAFLLQKQYPQIQEFKKHWKLMRGQSDSNKKDE